MEREEILRRLRELEGSSPANVAKIIATMKPPIETQIPPEGVPGLLELSFPGMGDEPEFRYYVQVPPEYDPSRRYPCIVTLHGAGSQPLEQIDWWAGASDPDATDAAGTGHAPRLLRDRTGLGQGESNQVRVLAARTCGGAGGAARCLSAFQHRYRSRLSQRAFDGR